MVACGGDDPGVLKYWHAAGGRNTWRSMALTEGDGCQMLVLLLSEITGRNLDRTLTLPNGKFDYAKSMPTNSKSVQMLNEKHIWFVKHKGVRITV